MITSWFPQETWMKPLDQWDQTGPREHHAGVGPQERKIIQLWIRAAMQ
jgi:hypothetical protein